MKCIMMLNKELANFHLCSTGDECRIVSFEEPIANKAIKGHVIWNEEVPNEGSCRVMCYMEPNCLSINVRPSQGGKYKCELNNATADVTFLENWETAYYLAVKVNLLRITITVF